MTRILAKDIIGVKKKNFTPFIMEKDLRFVELFELYKGLLTAKQKEIFEMHLLYDLSLNEIAEECGITRQNVSDALSKTKKKLEEFEKTLNLKRKKDGVNAVLENCKDKAAVEKISEIINS